MNRYAIVYTPTLMDVGQKLLFQTIQNNEDKSRIVHMFQLTEEVVCNSEQEEMFGARLEENNTLSF